MNNRVILTFLLILSCAGCGYRPLGKGSLHFSSVYIAPIKNKINVAVDYSSQTELEKFFPDVDSEIRSRLSRRFLLDGNMKTQDKNLAGLMLNVELISYRKDPVRFSSSGDIEAYRISIKAKIVGTDASGDIIFPDTVVTGIADYVLTGKNANTEDTAAREAIDDLVKRIVEAIVEQW